MKGQLLIYPADCDGTVRIVHDFTDSIPLEKLQEAVGGDIEAVPYWDTFEIDGKTVPAVVWCNEKGKLDGLPRNHYMTDLWEKHLQKTGLSRFAAGQELDFLVGSIAVCVGDNEFMETL
jgi:hypothetical protein